MSQRGSMSHRGFVAEDVTCSYVSLAEKGHLCSTMVQTVWAVTEAAFISFISVEWSDPSRPGRIQK